MEEKKKYPAQDCYECIHNDTYTGCKHMAFILHCTDYLEDYKNKSSLPGKACYECVNYRNNKCPPEKMDAATRCLNFSVLH